MTEEEKNNIINNQELDSNKNPEIVDENIDNTEEEFDEEYSLIDTELTGKDKITENNIVEEVKSSFLDYSVSVIASRALPDLRDGLKPVHRRILWSMYECGYTPDKPHRKSATTVGYVMGHYHPHGDSSIYDAMVRLAQKFAERYMLVDGHGNFGTIEGDSAAAYRYTEGRLSKISLEMLRDINKNTVDFDPNFDDSTKEPRVLPSRFPNILVNGTMGIAVGMATNIPPHNLGEVIDGCIAYIDNPDIDTIGLMNSMPSLAEEGKRLNTIEGSVPNPLYLPEGCYFADRCPYVTDRCKKGQPTDTKVKSRHHVWCFKVEEEMKQEG